MAAVSPNKQSAKRQRRLQLWEYFRRSLHRGAAGLVRNEVVATSETFDVPFAFLVTTTTGIYCVSGGRVTWLVQGFGFGVCPYRGRWFITLEQYLDPVETKYLLTQFLSFRLEGGRAVDLRLEKTGLPGGAHYLREFRNQFYFPHGGNVLARFPWPLSLYGWRGGERIIVDRAKGVPKCQHLNSVLIDDRRILVLAHNDSQKTNRNSAIYHLDHEGNLIEFEELNARGAHDLVETPDGVLYSNSFGGTFDRGGKTLFKPSLPVYARGVALHARYHVCGGSVPTERQFRERTPLLLFVTDSEWRELGRIRVDEFKPGCWGGAVHEIMLLP